MSKYYCALALLLGLHSADIAAQAPARGSLLFVSNELSHDISVVNTATNLFTLPDGEQSSASFVDWQLIPSALAYGPEDQPGIPANSVLVFIVDLKKIS